MTNRRTNTPQDRKSLSEAETSRIIEMAWEDRTPFEAIEKQYNVSESGVIKIMRANLKASSFRLWRKRVTDRKTKHEKISPDTGLRHRCSRQGKFPRS